MEALTVASVMLLVKAGSLDDWVVFGIVDCLALEVHRFKELICFLYLAAKAATILLRKAVMSRWLRLTKAPSKVLRTLER